MNIQADIVKYTAVQECQKSNISNMAIWTHDTCEEGLGYVVSTGGSDTISKPCQNQVHYVSNDNISQSVDIISYTDHSDLGSENWSSNLTKNLVNNIIIAYSRIEGAECFSNLSTYTDWSQLEYQAVSHQGWPVDYNISICGGREWRHSVESSMAYEKSNVQTHVSLDLSSELSKLHNSSNVINSSDDNRDGSVVFEIGNALIHRCGLIS